MFINVSHYILIYLFILLCGSENKRILIKRSIIFLKKSFKKFLKFLGKEPDLDLNKLSVNEWKFVPKSEISLLEIVTVKSDKNNKNNGAVGVKNDKNTSKKDHSVEIFFNAKSDVMIQTNYPLPKALKKGKNH